jgi:hypothetical protein
MNTSASTLCIAPEEIGVYWTMVSVDSWGPVGTTSGVPCHKRRMVSPDVRHQTAATIPRQMSLALALWRPKMQDALDVMTAGRCVGRVSPDPQWRRLLTRGTLVRRPKTNTKVWSMYPSGTRPCQSRKRIDEPAELVPPLCKYAGLSVAGAHILAKLRCTQELCLACHLTLVGRVNGYSSAVDGSGQRGNRT